MNPLISILIPAYNASEWLADTLESAIAQTWENKEIIVVDDGSQDNTPDVARKFETRGIRLICQRNQGASAARNTAFSASSGNFIQWLDADDLLAPQKIASQITALQELANPRILASGPWGSFYYRPWRAKFTPTDLWCNLSPKEWLLRKMQSNLHMQTATWLISRELSEAAGPWDTSMYVDDDGEYLCRVLSESDGVCFVPSARVYYRSLGTRSLSHIGRSQRKMEAQLRSMERHVSCLLSMEESDAGRAACLAYLQCWVGSFYPSRPDLVERADQMAQGLGGKLKPPVLSRKYNWIRPLLGQNCAFYVKDNAPQLAGSIRRWWDKVLLSLQHPSSMTTRADFE